MYVITSLHDVCALHRTPEADFFAKTLKFELIDLGYGREVSRISCVYNSHFSVRWRFYNCTYLIFRPIEKIPCFLINTIIHQTYHLPLVTVFLVMLRNKMRGSN